MSTKNTIENRKYKKHNFHGFTLVELIVVITILVILGTIAFTSLSGFSLSARDSSRVSDLNNLSKALELSYIKTSSYPTPDNAFTVTYSGWSVWEQGAVSDSVMRILNAWGVFVSKKPTDPLRVDREYSYSKLAYGKAYQLKSDWEGDSVVFYSARSYAIIPSFIQKNQWEILTEILSGFWFPQVQAANESSTLSYIKGNYNGVSAKTETGGIIYLLAIPSIVTLTGSTVSPEDIDIASNALSGTLALHGSSSVQWIAYNPNKVVYASGSLPSTIADQILFASGVAAAYSWASFVINSQINAFVQAAGNTGTLASLGGDVVVGALGGDTNTSTPPPPPPLPIDATCGTAQKTYSSGDTTFWADTFCTASNSTLSGSTPAFPAQGSNVSWTCNSLNAGASASCTAAREAITTFSLSASSTALGATVSITHNCTTPPTSYTSSDTNKATISSSTITTLAVGTITVTPVGGNCTDSAAKTLTITAPQYLGCGSPDILVGWKYWAACNVGASTVFTGYRSGLNDSPVATESNGGKYFQWGENVAWDYNGGSLNTDNCTWDRDTQSCVAGVWPLSAWSNSISDITSWGVDRWLDWSGIDTRGPCAPGYHVPTETEWNNAYVTLGSNRYTFVSTLKIPLAGIRDLNSSGAPVSQGVAGAYWSSSPSGANAYIPNISNSVVTPTSASSRAYAASVRCVK